MGPVETLYGFVFWAGIIGLISCRVNQKLKLNFVHKYSWVLLGSAFLLLAIYVSETENIYKILCSIIFIVIVIIIIKHPKFQEYKQREIEKVKIELEQGKPKKKTQLEILTEQAKVHLDRDEDIKGVILGFYKAKWLNSKIHRTGILLATNKRLFFYSKTLLGYKSETILYNKISSCQSERHFTTYKLKLFLSGTTIEISRIYSGDFDGFVEFLRSKIESE